MGEIQRGRVLPEYQILENKVDKELSEAYMHILKDSSEGLHFDNLTRPYENCSSLHVVVSRTL